MKNLPPPACQLAVGDGLMAGLEMNSFMVALAGHPAGLRVLVLRYKRFMSPLVTLDRCFLRRWGLIALALSGNRCRCRCSSEC